MSYAVKIGTTEALWIDSSTLPENCVRYEGDLLHRMIWDDALQNIRPMTAEEVARTEIAAVSAAQFQLALLDLGLLDDVENYIAAFGDRAMQLDWAKRQTYERNHPRIEQMRVLLGKTDAEVDAVFALAATK